MKGSENIKTDISIALDELILNEGVFDAFAADAQSIVDEYHVSKEAAYCGILDFLLNEYYERKMKEAF